MSATILTEEEIIAAVAKMQAGEASLGDMSEKLKVSAIQLQMWRKNYGPQALKLLKKPEPTEAFVFAKIKESKMKEVDPIASEPLVNETENITKEPEAQEKKPVAKKKIKKKLTRKTRTAKVPHERKLQAVRRCYKGDRRIDVAKDLGVCVQTIDLWKRNHGHEIQAENKAKKTLAKEAPVKTSKAIVTTPVQTAPNDRDSEIRNLKLIIANQTLEIMRLKGEI